MAQIPITEDPMIGMLAYNGWDVLTRCLDGDDYYCSICNQEIALHRNYVQFEDGPERYHVHCVRCSVCGDDPRLGEDFIIHHDGKFRCQRRAFCKECGSYRLNPGNECECNHAPIT